MREALGYPEPLSLDVIIPVGYREYTPGPPQRLPLKELIHHDGYEMDKHLRDEDFLQYIEKIRMLGKSGYRVAISEDKG